MQTFSTRTIILEKFSLNCFRSLVEKKEEV